MALAGCSHVGVSDPKNTRNLIAYVEIDRCATDAIQSVTGCKLGKRTLKYLDYGKMAASFLNTTTGHAVRVLARDDARERAWSYAPSGATKKEAQLEAYKRMPEEDLFVINPVRLELPEHDLPGHPLSRVTCDSCGEGINDRREVRHGEYTWCRACANGAYYHSDGFVPRRFESTGPGVVAVRRKLK
jgi:formylmethanofuran dehydrogenase subunit E